jgi:hypothetical protein
VLAESLRHMEHVNCVFEATPEGELSHSVKRIVCNEQVNLAFQLDSEISTLLARVVMM